MLLDVFKVIVNNLFKENFYRKKKVINVLTFFLFLIKVVSRLF